jgi:hypothetical protein
VIAGMTANLCCEATGRRATEEGYDVTFVGNAIGAESIPAYEASVLLNFPLIANAVMDVDAFLAAVDTSAVDISGESPVAVQPGDRVFGSDHLEVGTIEEVVAATGDTDAYLLVPRGLIFKTDTCIPLDAVVKRAGTEVFINVPKVVVGNMPWNEPPSRAERQAKQGPRATEVGKLYGSHSRSIHEQ